MSEQLTPLEIQDHTERMLARQAEERMAAELLRAAGVAIDITEHKSYYETAVELKLLGGVACHETTDATPIESVAD